MRCGWRSACRASAPAGAGRCRDSRRTTTYCDCRRSRLRGLRIRTFVLLRSRRAFFLRLLSCSRSPGYPQFSALNRLLRQVLSVGSREHLSLLAPEREAAQQNRGEACIRTGCTESGTIDRACLVSPPLELEEIPVRIRAMNCHMAKRARLIL